MRCLVLSCLCVFYACAPNPKEISASGLEAFSTNMNFHDLETKGEVEGEFKSKDSKLTLKIRQKKNYLKVKVNGKELFLNKGSFILFPLKSDEDFALASQHLEIAAAAKKMGFISPKVQIIALKFPDTELKYYLFQEKANKQIMESNGYRAGKIFKHGKKGKIKYEYNLEKGDQELIPSIKDYQWNPENVKKHDEFVAKYPSAKNDFLLYLNPISNELEWIFYPKKLQKNTKELESAFAVGKEIVNQKFLKYFKEGKNPKSLFPIQSKLTIQETITIPYGYEVIIPKGTHLNLIRNSAIISYSNISMNGQKTDSVVVSSSDHTGQGLHIFNAEDSSAVHYVSFSKLHALQQGAWELPSAVTFYNSSVNISNSSFVNSMCEDAINVFRSPFLIENSMFKNTKGDALDSDFSKGEIKNSVFLNCGNDALDISGAEVIVGNCNFSNIGDKAISVGENGKCTALDIRIQNSELGICVKDHSKVKVKEGEIKNTKVAYCLFRKKLEFGFPELYISNTVIQNVEELFLLEKKSILFIDGKQQIEFLPNVEKYLYGNEYGKKSER